MNIKEYLDILKDLWTPTNASKIRMSISNALEMMGNNLKENIDRQDNVENQFQDVLDETTGKDIINGPEIIAARNGEANLKARLDKEKNEVTSQLAQKVYYTANVTEMKNMVGLKDGDTVVTLGYYHPNDGGGGEYVVKKDSTLIEDNGSVHNLPDELKAELIIKNSKVNVKQFGAKGNCNYFDNGKRIFYEDKEFFIESQDDTQFIQSAYDFAKRNRHRLTSLEIFFPNGDYGVSSTIFISDNVDSDFNYSTLHVLKGGTFRDKYVIRINTTEGNTWDVEYPHRKGYFKNVNVENKKYLLNVKFILSGVSYEFKNIQSECMIGTLIYINKYIDRKTIENVFVLFPRLDTEVADDNLFGTNFQISLGQGDSGYIRDIFMGGTANRELSNYPNEEDPGKLLYIAAADVSVDGVINGLVRINYNSIVGIKNFHGEKGKLEVFNSRVRLSDSLFFRREHFSPITVKDDEYAGGTGKVPHDSSFDNVVFENRYDWFNYAVDLPEFDLRDSSGLVKIKQCYRRNQPFGRPKNRLYSSGVKIRLRDGVKAPNSSNVEIRNNKMFLPNTKIQVDNSPVYLGAANEEGIVWNAPLGTYHYKAIQLIDGKRLIGKIAERERIVEKTDKKSYIFLSIDEVLEHSATRFYRGTASGQYTEYVDVPNAVSTGYADNGYGVNGYLWKPINGDPLQDINIVYDIEYWNENIRVTRGAKPNYGNWEKGDIIYNRNPKSGASFGWLCLESGKPGVWKGFGVIE